MSPYRDPLRLVPDQPPRWRCPFTIEVDERAPPANVRAILAALLATTWSALGLSVLSGMPHGIALWNGSMVFFNTAIWFGLTFKLVKVSTNHE